MGADICVVDEEGVIVKVNRAWREFGQRNGGVGELAGVGSHYLQVCERAAQSGDAGASVWHFICALQDATMQAVGQARRHASGQETETQQPRILR